MRGEKKFVKISVIVFEKQHFLGLDLNLRARIPLYINFPEANITFNIIYGMKGKPTVIEYHQLLNCPCAIIHP